MHSHSNRVLLLWLLLVCASSAVAQAPPDQDEVGRISGALQSHDFTEALALSQAALAARPNDYRLWTLRGIATAGKGNLPLALTAYRHALKLAPEYLPALEGAAQSEFQMGQDAARPLLLKVLAQRPDDPTSHAMLGVLEYRNKNCSEAMAHFQKAARAIATQPAALTEYGTCLAVLYHDEDAVTVFAAALALDPSKAEARYNLALAQFTAHQSDDALATLQPITEASPADGAALTLAAEILEANNETPRAVELLRKAILANPKDVDAYLHIAALSFDHASPQVGIDVLGAGLTELPNEPRFYLVRGILQTQLGEFTRAAEDFEAASRIDPQLSFLGVAEGLVKSQQHLSAEALAKFRAAVKAHPNEAYAQYLLAEALQTDGQPSGSAGYKEEVEAATRAVKLDPHLLAARDLLSTIYFANGQMDLAIEQSRAALAIDPNDQQAVYHLILGLRKTNQKDQIPALLNRMAKLREDTENDEKAGKKYRLYEAPASTTTPANP